MTVLVVDKTVCRICNKIIIKDDNYIGFPVLIYDGDELDFFSDGVFHLDCFMNHKMKGKVLKSLEKIEVLRKSKSGKGIPFV